MYWEIRQILAIYPAALTIVMIVVQDLAVSSVFESWFGAPRCLFCGLRLTLHSRRHSSNLSLVVYIATFKEVSYCHRRPFKLVKQMWGWMIREVYYQRIWPRNLDHFKLSCTAISEARKGNTIMWRKVLPSDAWSASEVLFGSFDRLCSYSVFLLHDGSSTNSLPWSCYFKP